MKQSVYQFKTRKYLFLMGKTDEGDFQCCEFPYPLGGLRKKNKKKGGMGPLGVYI